MYEKEREGIIKQQALTRKKVESFKWENRN